MAVNKLTSLLLIASAMIATARSSYAENCTNRANYCSSACTPALVASGEQVGGTIAGCLASCKSRLYSCLKSGVWTHMGRDRRGERQKVDRS